MAKKSGSGNGVSDWHKQQHKKQLQKNKQARIAARDERVVQEKTIASVRDEIHKLERLHKHSEQQPRPHAITSKLDRLHKELKLIQANADKLREERSHNSNTANAATAKTHAIDQTQYVPLDNPAVSIYYDAHLNPYGAPPPGQPKLYHRRGGGTTSNLNEACTLAEQFIPPPPPPPPRSSIPPPPPPPPRAAPTTATGGAGGRPYTSSSSNRKPHQSVVQPQSRHVPQNGSTNNNALQKSNNQSQQQGAAATLSSTTSNKTLVDPSIPPPLPPPSASVQRCFKKSAVDIWASSEEVEYEAAVSSASGFALEGVAVATTAVAKSGTSTTAKAQSAATTTTAAADSSLQSWYYQDSSGAIQGPFTTLQMQGWVQAGFFPGTTPLSANHANGPWIELDHVPIFNCATSSSASAPSVPAPALEGGNLPQEIAKTSTVQDRIAALRQSVQQKPMEQLPEPNDIDEHDNEPPQSSSVADRMAALRQERLQEEQEEEGDNDMGAMHASTRGSGGGGASSTVQDRIAALKVGRNGESTASCRGGGDLDNGQDNHSVQDRIEALRAQHYNSTLSEANATDAPPPMPPAPAPRHEDYTSDVAPYPVDEDDNGDDDAAVPYLEYPLNDEGDDDAYDVAYPIDEDGDTGDGDDDDAPVTGDYDMADYYDDDGQDGDDDPSSQELQSRYSTVTDKADASKRVDDGQLQRQQLAQPPKKKIKVNQAVVALLPSHLRKATAAAAPR